MWLFTTFFTSLCILLSSFHSPLRFLSESAIEELHIIIREREGVTKLKKTLKYLYLFLAHFCKHAIRNHKSLE